MCVTPYRVASSLVNNLWREWWTSVRQVRSVEPNKEANTMGTTTSDVQTIRRRAVGWLLDVIDDQMLRDIGEVATPLDDLSPADERRAVEWLRARVARLDTEETS